MFSSEGPGGDAARGTRSIQAGDGGVPAERGDCEGAMLDVRGI